MNLKKTNKNVLVDHWIFKSIVLYDLFLMVENGSILEVIYGVNA